MKDNVIKFIPPKTAENPDHVLEQAKGQYSDVLIVGWDKDGYLDVRGSLGMTNQEALWLIEKFQHKLMNGDYTPNEN